MKLNLETCKDQCDAMAKGLMTCAVWAVGWDHEVSQRWVAV